MFGLPSAFETPKRLTSCRENNRQDREHEDDNHGAHHDNETALSICVFVNEHTNEQEQEEQGQTGRQREGFCCTVQDGSLEGIDGGQ